GSKTIDEIDVFSLQDNPSAPDEPTLSLTFSSYGVTAFAAQYWNGTSWVTVPGGSVTGNNKVWKQLTFSPVTTSKIRVLISGTADGYSRLTEVEAWGTAMPAVRLNQAAAVNGGSATASETHSAQYAASGAINGDRKYYTNNAWANVNASFPQWLQVDFNGSKTIDEIDVFSLQDNPSAPSEPTLSMTFNSYGVTAFAAQYWNGTSWVTVPGGSVTGNNKVWKQITFSPVTTSKIRVLISGTADSYSRLTEVEAWGTSGIGGGASASIQWLVTDHLGTPRMVFDQTGSLANVRRHDYLPFGEELIGLGLRSTALGYSGGDGVRQQFTQKERDIETGLDYFGARYYFSAMGRFTSPDQPFIDQEEGDPQSWNLYSYVRNNPLRFSDPTGQARWEEIDGELHWVGDVDGEYDKDLGATWVAVEGNPIGGYWDFGGDQSPVVDQEEHIRQVFHLDPDKYSFEPPGVAGLRIAGSAGRASKGLLGRLISWAFKRGGSGTVSAAARPVTGQLFERTLQTSKGPVDILAEVVVVGDKLVLKDIAIFGRGSQPLTGLTREILAATSQLKDEARALGFTELQIIGKRALTSTSRNPGHEVNVTIRLQ
ncbi:MAG TPA: RHS repeat-associated core domain-containing protein, partial [Candidatus Saccharimonadales bacterium]|nr:RHS repeat-associated core domain-containing protein [Candidatus Saccharimonadales bacterium]